MKKDIQKLEIPDKIMKQINLSVEYYMLRLDLPYKIHIRDIIIQKNEVNTETLYTVSLFLEYTYNHLPDPGKLFTKLLDATTREIRHNLLLQNEKIYIQGINLSDFQAIPSGSASGKGLSLFKHKMINLLDYKIYRKPNLV